MKKYTKKITGVMLTIFTVMLTLNLLITPQLIRAATIGGEVFLQGNFVEVGIHNSGSFGTSNYAPAGFHPKLGGTDRRLGFVVDMQKDGWTNGTPPQSGDFFLPGSPEEGWTVEWNGAGGAERNFGNYGLNGLFQIPKTSLIETSFGDTRSAVWEGTAIAGSEQLKITKTIHFKTGDQFFVISTVMTNVGTTTLNSVEFMRNVDPDQEQPITGNFATSNYVSNSGDKKLVVGKGLTYGIPLGLGSIDSRAIVSTEGFSNRDPDAIYDSPVTPSKDSPIIADQAIALAYRFGNLAPGQSVSFDYAYILNESDLETALSNLAAISILQPTGTVSGSSVLFQATTEDIPNTTQMDFYVNGTLIGTDTTPDDGGVFEISFDSLSYPNGTINLKVVATFAGGGTVEKTSTVSIDNSGPPISFSTPTSGQVFSVGASIPVSIDVLNPAQPPVRVSFFRESASSGSFFLGEDTSAPFGSNFNVTGLPEGETVVIKAVAYDSANRVTTIQVSGVTRTNQVPTANSQTVSTTEDNGVAVTLTGSDPEGSSLSYSVVSGPSNGTLSGTAPDLTYTPNLNFNGSDSFTFKVNDGSLNSNIATVTINVAAVNDAPVLAGVPPSPVIDEMVAYSFHAMASDVDSPAPLFSLVGAVPTGATIDVASGIFTWTPTEAQGPGIYNFKVRATDNEGAFDEDDISIEVREVNIAPQFTSVPTSAVIDELSAYGFTATATDSDVPTQTLTFSLDGAPAGAAITSGGVFSWTPSEVQGNGSTYTFTVRVSDGVVNTDVAVSLTVNEVNTAPVLGAITTPASMQWGNVLGFTASAADSDLPANTLTFSLVNAPAGAGINPSTGAFSWTPAAGQIGSHTFKVVVTDNGNPAMSDERTINITVTKRPTTLVYTGDASEQYSDQQALSATLVDAQTSTPLSDKTVGFTIGSQNTSAVTDGSGVAASNLILTQSPNSYTLATVFAGDSAYSASDDSDQFAITREDARATYTGLEFVTTPGTSANVQLSATVQDISAVTGDPDHDALAGDIRNARVTFVNRDNNNAAITGCTNLTPNLVSASDNKTGTVACLWQNVATGNSSATQYTIGIVVNNYYTRDSSTENTTVTVSQQISGMITGGGNLINVASAGEYAGSTNLKTNFGFNVKYNKQMTNLQGNVNIIIRAANGKVYQIKANSMTSMQTSVATGVSSFESKANLTDITNPNAPISLGGNLNFQMVMKDNGEPGANDTIGITLRNSAGAILYSSNWSGVQTVQQKLNGGNLVVR